MFLPFLNHLDGGDWPEELQPYLVTYNARGEMVHEDHEHLPHALALYQLILDLKAQVVVELGTRLGKSARIIIAALRQTGGHLWSIDIGAFSPPLARPEDSSFVTFVTADDRTVPWDRMVDVCFIDSSHTYDHTFQELEKFWKFVKSPGALVVADYDAFLSEKRAVQDWSEIHQIGYIADIRAQGCAYFLKPVYPTFYRAPVGRYSIE